MRYWAVHEVGNVCADITVGNTKIHQVMPIYARCSTDTASSELCTRNMPPEVVRNKSIRIKALGLAEAAPL